jgi:O-antigen/teichoic acid export membrane protein
MLAIAKKLGRSLYYSGAVRQSALMTIGTVLTGLLMAIAFIFVSRVLGPERFGVFSVSLALMGLLMRIPDLGLSQVMLKMLGNWHTQEKKIQSFLSLILYWKVWLSGGLLLIGTLLIPVFERVLKYPYPWLLFLTVVGSVLITFYEYVYVVLASKHNFKWVTILGTSQSVIKSVGFAILLYVGVRAVEPLAVIYFLAPAIVAAFFLVRFRRQMLFFPTSGTSELRGEIKTFAIHAAFGTLFMTLISNLDLLLVQSALNPFETGIYSGAGKIAVFVAFLSSAIGGVLNNRVARYRDRTTLQSYLKKSLSIVLLSALGFIAFVPFAGLIVRLTIGPEYSSGVAALIVLVLNAFLSMAVVPYIAFFYAVDRPAYFSVGGLIQVVIIVLGNMIFLPSVGIMAAAWSRVLATSIFALFTAWSIWQEMRSGVVR